MEKEIEELKAALAAKDAELGKKDAIISDQEKLIADMHQSMAAQEAQTGVDVIVIHDKKKYRVTVPKFNYAAKEVTAEQLKDSKTIVADLIKKGSSILELVK